MYLSISLIQLLFKGVPNEFDVQDVMVGDGEKEGRYNVSHEMPAR